MTERGTQDKANNRDRNGLGKERMGAFRDGVFAFAITRLVPNFVKHR